MVIMKKIIYGLCISILVSVINPTLFVNSVSAETISGFASQNAEEWIVTPSADYYVSADEIYYQFSLLDADVTNKEFFCYSAYSYTSLPFDSAEATAKYSSAEGSNVGYWINTELAEKDSPDYLKMDNESYAHHPSYSKTFPKIIRNYLLNHEYTVKKGGSVKEDLTFTAKLALLSYDELKAYSSKIGYSSGSGYVRTRSPYTAGSSTSTSTWCFASSSGITSAISPSSLGLIRPCFYLGEEFFSSVKLNLEKTGIEVKKLLKECFSKTELKKAGYSESELKLLGYDVDESVLVERVNLSYTKTFPGYTVTATPVGTAELDKTKLGTKWQISNDGETWSDIAGAEGESYIIQNSAAEKYIRAVSYVIEAENDLGIYSDKLKTEAALGAVSTGNPGVPADTPIEYTAVIEGQDLTFQVLDSEKRSGEMQYLCYANFVTGTAPWTTSGTDTGARFNPENPDNVAYWMNNAMIADNPEPFGNGKIKNAVPDEIKMYAVDYDWRTEKGNTKYADVSNDYVLSCRFALLSYNEYKNYKDKIGYNIDDMSGYVRFRTPNMHYSQNSRTERYAVSNGGVNSAVCASALDIRPCFYLGSDFFRRVKLDLTKTGDSVKGILIRNYTENELLQAGYSTADVEGLKAFAEAGNFEISAKFPKEPTYVVNKDELYFNLSILSDIDAVLDVIYVIDGNSTASYKIDVTKNELYNKNFDLGNLSYGMHNIQVYVKRLGSTLYNSSRDIAVVRKYTEKNMDSFERVGVNLNNTDENALKLLQDIGINRVRYSISWYAYEPTKGRYDTDSADSKMNLLKKYGLKPIMTLAYTNPKYMAGERSPYTKEQIEGFTGYARSLAERYPDVEAFSIWNEPNLGFWKPEPNVIEYFNLVKETSKAIKSVNPEISVNAGVLAKKDGELFQRQLLELGMAKYVDTISFHPYSFPRSADVLTDRDITRYSSGDDAFGGWIDYRVTEIGWPTHTSSSGVEDDIAASNLIKSIAKSDDAGILDMYWYCLVDSGEDAAYNEDNFGLLEYDLSAKDGYVALAQFMTEIGGGEYLGKVKIGNNSIGYIYSVDGKSVMLAWSLGDKETVSITGATGAADIYGNNMDIAGGVTLSAKPSYITFDNDTAAVSAVFEYVQEMYDEVSKLAGISLTAPVYAGKVALSEQIIGIYNDAEGLENTTASEKLNNAAKRIAALKAFMRYSDYDSVYRFNVSLPQIPVEKIYSNKMLTAAREYKEKGEKLSEVNSTAVSAALESWNLVANGISSLAEACAETADIEKDMLILTTPSIIEGVKTQDVSISIYNNDQTSVCDVEIYDQNNNLKWSEEAVTIAGGAKTEILSAIEIDETVGGEYIYKILLKSAGNIIAQQGILVDVPMQGRIDTGELSGYKQNTAEDDCFYVGEDKYALLDVNENGEFFVLCMSSLGDMVFDADGEQKFKPSDENNIGYALNTLVPSYISDYALMHRWYTEGGNSNGDVPFDYEVDAKISLLSYSELEAYKDIIGIYDNIESWWLRTPRGLNGEAGGLYAGLAVDGANSGTTQVYTYNKAGVRPCFWVDAGFFKNVSIDTDKIGANVKTAMSNNLNAAELLSGTAEYSTEALREIFGSDMIVSTEVQPDGIKLLVANLTGKEQSGNVYLAKYSEDILLDVKVNGGKLKEGLNTYNITPYEISDQIKVMVWDNTSQAPLSDVLKVTK